MNAHAPPPACCPSCGRPLVSEALSRLAGLPLTKAQRIIATTLARQIDAWVPTEELIATLYADRTGGAPERARQFVWQFIARMRAELASEGLRIEALNGRKAGGSWRRMVMTENASAKASMRRGRMEAG